MHFDPAVSYKYGAARKEAERLWQDSIDTHDNSIATAVAGAILYIVFAADGGKCFSNLPFERCALN